MSQTINLVGVHTSSSISLTGTSAAQGLTVVGVASISGPQGDTGPGVPVGGSTGQILAKNSATDYDTEWVNPPVESSGGGGSGTITGPISSADNALVRWDGGDGTAIQSSSVTLDDAGNLATSGNFDIDSANMSITSGNLDLSGAFVSGSFSDIELDNGSLDITSGSISIDTGNLEIINGNASIDGATHIESAGGAADALRVKDSTASTPALLVDSWHAKVGLGTSSPGNVPGMESVRLELADEDGSNSDILFRVAGEGFNSYYMASSKGTLDSPTILDDDTTIGTFFFMGYNGTEYLRTSAIVGKTPAGYTPSATSMPGQISFKTIYPGFVGSVFSEGNTQLTVVGDGRIGVGNVTPPKALFSVGQGVSMPGRVATTATTALVGTDTMFTNTFKIGDSITVSGETNRVVATITDDTHLTVTVAFSNTASGLFYLIPADRPVITALGNGRVGLGTNAPTAQLHLSAGTALNAPLKLTSGTNLTTPLAGSVEYDGTNLYLTDSTVARRTVTLNDTTQTLTNKDLSSATNTLPASTALKSATTSVNVSAATAPTTGQVLTATDSTHATWQTPSGGAPTPKMTFAWNLYNASDYGSATSGAGAAVTGNGVPNGAVKVASGTTSSGYADVFGPSNTNLYQSKIYDKNPFFYFTGDSTAVGANNGVVYITMERASSAGSPVTEKYIGFKVVNTAGTAELYSVHRDGTNAEVATLISGGFAAISGFSRSTFAAVMTSGTNIKFSLNGTVVATHTTNLPSGDLSGNRPWQLSSYNTSGAGSNAFEVFHIGISVDAY